MLTLNTPDVSSDTEYSLSISSSISGTSTPVLKQIKLSVQICKVVNWNKWSKTNTSYWDTCNSGYNLDSGLCYLSKSKIEPNIGRIFSIVLQVFAWITLVICLISSYMNPSSISSFWSMVSQLQFFFLLLLTKSHTPLDVVETITGAKFALNPISILHLQDAEEYKSVFQGIYFDLTYPEFRWLDIKSESTLYNILPLLIFISLTVIVFMLISFLNWLFERLRIQNKWSRIVRVFKWLDNIKIKIFKVSMYIRLTLMMNLYILISITNEINTFNLSNSLRIISLLFTIWLMFCLLFLIGVTLSLALTSDYTRRGVKILCEEFFTGLKQQKEARIYVSVQLIRRVYFVVLLVIFPTVLDIWPMILMLITPQLMYLLLFIYIRPFEEIKGNVIEIANEIIFLYLLFNHFFLNSEDKWNSASTALYSSIIVVNILIIFLIVLCKYFMLYF